MLPSPSESILPANHARRFWTWVASIAFVTLYSSASAQAASGAPEITLYGPDSIELVQGTPIVTAWGENSWGQCSGPAAEREVVAVAAGSNFSLALKKDGTVRAWGFNEYGQCNVPSNLSNVVAIAVGNEHSMALKNDGTVVAWGRNSGGAATVPAGLSNVVAISGGQHHSLALKGDGTVVNWGYNNNSAIWPPVGLNNVVAIAAGGYHNVALKADGTVVAWGSVGNNNWGQLEVPANLSGAVSITAGLTHTGVVLHDGTVQTFGISTDNPVPPPPGLTDVKTISARSSFNLVLKNDATVAAWGSPYSRGLAIPAGLSNVRAISAGSLHALALGGNIPTLRFGNVVTGAPVEREVTITNTGTAALTGLDAVLEGPNLAAFLIVSDLPTELPSGGSAVLTVRCDPLTISDKTATLKILSNDSDEGIFLISLNATGKVPQIVVEQPPGYRLRSGGGNYVELFGISDSGISPPENLLQARSVACGYSYSGVLNKDGTTVFWGKQLGNEFGYTIPPSNLTDIRAIDSGDSHTVTLDSTGHVQVWGSNERHQREIPPGLSHVVSVSASGYHTMALKDDGTVVSWGDNGDGQISPPAGLKNVRAIAAGRFHSTALRYDGVVLAWGAKGSRQTSVPAFGHAKAIASSGYHTLALKTDGTVVGWGENGYGQCVPPRGLKDVVEIAAGSTHSVALKADGTVVAWGDAGDGRIAFPENYGGVSAVSAEVHETVVIRDPGDFRNVKLGTMVDRSFTFSNTGAEPLTGISVSIEGPDADLFSVVTPPPSTLAAYSGLASFTVRFAPGAMGGQRQAILTIASNDPDDPSFTIPLAGLGEQPAQPAGTRGAVFTATSLRYDKVTGSHLQTINFRNTTGSPLFGLGVRVNRLLPAITLLGASEGLTPGSLDVFYSNPIAKNETISFTISYLNFDPSANNPVAALPSRLGRTFIKPITPEKPLALFMDAPLLPAEPIGGTLVPLTQCVNSAFGPVLTWSTTPGKDYVVEYSANNTTWTPAVHLLRAKGSKIIWIDRGQPETISKPKGKANNLPTPPAGSRYYRIKEL